MALDQLQQRAYNGRSPNGERKEIEDVLERLALAESWDLCNEAKAEKCRATRDLRSCGRVVQHLLTSCGHACLCVECSHRCDICPVCRTPISRAQPVLRLRLYDECVETGLLPLVQEEDFRAREKEGPYWTYDSWRLCSFFDVALDNNLVSVVCHYVTDVCMDDTAVSSDAVISMLLDGAVVKEWCSRTLIGIIRSLRETYNSKLSFSRTDVLDKQHRRLQGLCNVLEALEGPLDSSSTSFLELQQLLDGVRMVMQHLEVMEWYIRHRCLENVPCAYHSMMEWKLAFQDRKQAANLRAWPDYVAGSGRLGPKPGTTLFIEDALENIGITSEGEEERNEYVNLLRNPSAHGSYPPESVTAAIDLLFLGGTPDLGLAKKATFLYYLYDRHWKLGEHERDAMWEPLLDDYANTFSISRQWMLESFVFYLLDNNTDLALEKACRLLPEVVSSNLHPKIARVLLERGRVEAAHCVLQSSGRFGLTDGLPAVPLSEAVTAIRVWIKCGLLKEAYKFLKRHCKAVKAEVRAPRAQDDGDTFPRDWTEELEVLVGELCSLCIQLNCVNEVLELPWQQVDEEKILKKCFFEHALHDPSSATGSLLVIYFLQRCRFLEASKVHEKLLQFEQQVVTNCPDGEKAIKLQSMRDQRTKLLEKCLEQLPEVVRDRQLPEEASSSRDLSLDATPDAMEEDPFSQHHQTKRLSFPASMKDLISPAAPSNLLISKRPAADEANIPPSSNWAGFRPPSVLQNKHFKSTPVADNSPFLSPAKSPLLLNGFASGEFRAASPVLSPLLGKRLRYENEADAYRHVPNGDDVAAGSARKNSAQAMVVTW